ncbi:MAG: hypothetical protein K6F30_08940 [Lachnospiraceae bacterium]|nr:hypothetical protein [Lachnospiraceae bacterium]
MDDIIKRLEKFHLAYNFSSEIQDIRLQYNSIGNHDAAENFKNCLDWCCHTVRGNLIGGCYYAVTGDISNEIFGTDLPVEECCWDYTFDEFSGAEILQRMNAPTKLCAYCNSFPSPIQPWHQVVGTPEAKDWFYNE